MSDSEMHPKSFVTDFWGAFHYCADRYTINGLSLIMRMIKQRKKVYKPTVHHWWQMLSGTLHHRLKTKCQTD